MSPVSCQLGVLLDMFHARRSSCFLSVFLFLLINGAPSLGQNETTTVEPTEPPTLTNTTTTDLTTPTLDSATPSTSTPPPVLPLGAVIGIAVGGGALLICAAVSCLCLCVICCSRRRSGRNKNFNPSVIEKEPLEGGSPTYRTLSPPQDLDQKEGGNDEFEMQVNVALSGEDIATVSDEHNVKPADLFAVKKSASSSNIHETKFQREDHQAATNPASASNTDANPGQPSELKGYVQMSSAGSVRPSRSVGDIAGLEEQDLGIYVEPDRTGAAILIQAESYRDPPPKAPPKLHPKTPSISALIAAENSTATSRHEPTLATTQELGGEEYMAPDIFRIDRQTQDEIDSYYNKDTIESIRQGRGLSDVVDPSDALYTSVNSSTSTPSHQHNKIDDGHLGNREELSSASVAKSSSSAAAVEGAGEEAEHDSGEEGYYNVKRHTSDSDDDDNYDYYNSVQGVGGSSNKPLLDPDDNQYVYIEKSDISRSVSSAVTTATAKPTVAVKPRHLTSPASPVPQPRKYVNLGPNQRQLLQEKTKITVEASAGTITQDTMSHDPLTNGATVGGASDFDDSADQPLYENFREEEEDDEGGKEIYENILR